MKLGQVFDPRNNALNAWRLGLALSVIFCHSWPLTGHKIANRPIQQLTEQVGVDGFFAISGFLITASWLRHPKLRDFATARALRIFPGLWVSLAIIAFVFAPLSVAVQHGSVTELLSSHKPIEYVLNNAILNTSYVGIDGTPRNIPWPGVWDGPLWTLTLEVLCYIAVAVLGGIGLLRKRWTIATAFLIMLCATTLFPYPTLPTSTVPEVLARFSVMFAAGALLHRYRDAIPARWSLVALGTVIVLASGLLFNYRELGALPLAYTVIVSGSLVKYKHLNLRNDISYGIYIYGFPIQQLLAVFGMGAANPFLFFAAATAATIPMATGSWFLIEKHAMKLKTRIVATRATHSAETSR